MFCTQCGSSLGDTEPNFCPSCGLQTGPGRGQYQARARTLQRPREGRRIAGVCAGFAEYLDVDVTLIRIAWVVALFCFGTGFLAYLVAALVIQNEEMRAPGHLAANKF
ncbi:MAG: PspC domain-containing protein [Bryobacteraceae bacterium]